MKIKQLMHRTPVTIRKDDQLKAARAVMRRCDIRHLPVVEDGAIVGVLTDRDIAHYTERCGESLWSGGSHPVSAAMRTPVYVIRPDDTVKYAATTMAECRIGCLPVVEDNVLVGIVTSVNVLAALGGQTH